MTRATGYPLPLHPHSQRWRPWWRLLALGCIGRLRAARLPQLFPSSPEQPLPNPARQAEPGAVGRPAEQVQLIRLQAHVECGGVLAAAVFFVHAAMVARKSTESQHKVLTWRIHCDYTVCRQRAERTPCTAQPATPRPPPSGARPPPVTRATAAPPAARPGRTPRPLRPSPRCGSPRAVLVLSLLTEGMSIRAAERISGHHRDTICRLVLLAGEKCEALLATMNQNVEVENVECDELWAFIGMKERTRAKKGIKDPEVGDSYTFLGLDADSKLILTHHTGRRTAAHTDAFVEKLDQATAGRFQLTTDGFWAYPDAIGYHLGTRTDYATLIKEYGTETQEERRYSPPRIIATTKTTVHGKPDEARICTSHVERLNLDTRMQNRRFTRLTNAFSKSARHHRAAVAVWAAAHNLVKMHSSIRMTPAMKAGLVNRPWSVADLLAAA